MHTLNWENSGPHQGLHRTYSGKVKWPDLERSVTAVHADPRYQDLGYIINDFTECETLEIAEDRIEEIAARNAAAEQSHRFSKTLKKYRVAFVAANPAVRFKVATYLDLHIAKSPAGLFNTLSEARDWLKHG